MKHLLIPILCLFLLSACKQNKNVSPETKASEQFFKTSTALDVASDLKATDSLEILFYDNLDGDPKRYTRFFKFIASNDTSIIKALITNLNTAITGTVLKDCKSDGKIYCRNQDAIINTIYFGYRSEKCLYLYFIKNGNYYYVNIDTTVIKALNNVKKKAKKPVNK